MQRMRSIPRARLCMLMTTLFIFVGCGPRPDITSIELLETGDQSLQGVAETIRINNCGGETKLEQNIQQFHEIVIARVSSELSTQVLQEAVTAHYATDYGTSRNISITIPPKTHKEFVIAWMYETHSGILMVKGKSEQVSYMIKIAFGVGPVSSADLGCST